MLNESISLTVKDKKEETVTKELVQKEEQELASSPCYCVYIALYYILVLYKFHSWRN
jgi:hypothetical protein